jgi:2-C-methyl-D-erythritol 4-phosphate cytidylyltransferase
MRAQHPMEARLAAQVDALIRQHGDDPRRRHVGEARFIGNGDDARPFRIAEGLGRGWPDGIRPAVSQNAAILATPVVGTLKRVGPDGTITETVDRTGLWEAQTPQVFSRDLLERAFAVRQDGQPTDEAQLVEGLGQRVTVVPGSPINLKITSREDLRLAEQALKALPKPKLGGPAHPFANDDMWR